MEIKDIELLNKKRNEILNLERKIEILPEIIELKKLQKEETEIRNKINKYSTYNSLQIGNIIAKLMTNFEKVEYHCSKNNLSFLDYDYCIEPKYNRDNIYPSFKFKNIKHDNFFVNREECYLVPSNYKTNNSQNNEIEYIQFFIDYLYEKRSNRLLLEVSELDLEEILQEFLKLTENLQEQRMFEITKELEKRIKEQKRKEFEKSCMIDRKLIFNSLTYVINHYEDNMSAKQEKEEEWKRNYNWSKLTCYHKLTINSNDKEVCFKTEIDSKGCYPDEEYCGIYIDINKDTSICFFDLKNKLLPIIDNSNYLNEFMNMIENLYYEGKKINNSDIQEFLILLSNQHKVKQKN